MSEKVHRLGLRRDPTLYYLVTAEGVFTLPQVPSPDAEPACVVAMAVAIDHRYLYFVDRDGDIARQLLSPGATDAAAAHARTTVLVDLRDAQRRAPRQPWERPAPLPIDHDRCDDGDSVAVVRAMVEAVNALVSCGWWLHQLPARAVQLYFADFFVAQVRNGGLAQFLYNARPLARVRWYARAGLDAVGASALRGVLDDAIACYRADDQLRAQLDRRGVWDALAAARPRLESAGARFFALDHRAQWTDAAAHHVATSPDFAVLHPAAYQRTLTELAEAARRASPVHRASSPGPHGFRYPRYELDLLATCERHGREFQGVISTRELTTGVLQCRFAAADRQHQAKWQGQVIDTIWDVARTPW